MEYDFFPNNTFGHGYSLNNSGCMFGGLFLVYFCTYDLSAVKVENKVQVIPCSFYWTGKIGDIPALQLFWGCCAVGLEFIPGCACLSVPTFDERAFSKQSVGCRGGTVVLPCVRECSDGSFGWKISICWAVKYGKEVLFLFVAQFCGSMRMWSSFTLVAFGGYVPTFKGAQTDMKFLTRGAEASTVRSGLMNEFNSLAAI